MAWKNISRTSDKVDKAIGTNGCCYFILKCKARHSCLIITFIHTIILTALVFFLLLKLINNYLV